MNGDRHWWDGLDASRKSVAALAAAVLIGATGWGLVSNRFDQINQIGGLDSRVLAVEALVHEQQGRIDRQSSALDDLQKTVARIEMMVYGLYCDARPSECVAMPEVRR